MGARHGVSGCLREVVAAHTFSNVRFSWEYPALERRKWLSKDLVEFLFHEPARVALSAGDVPKGANKMTIPSAIQTFSFMLHKDTTPVKYGSINGRYFSLGYFNERFVANWKRWNMLSSTSGTQCFSGTCASEP